MYTVRAGDAQEILSALPPESSDVQLGSFKPDARCSVSIESTRDGSALLLIADNGAYRALVTPDYSPRVLKALKESGSYQREGAQGRAQWAIARAQAATAAA